MEVRKVLLENKELLYAFSTNMLLHAYSSSVISLPDVFLDDIPLRLPPLRGIEHYIDVSPRASLPNKAAYKTNPKEGKEIQKQLGKLLAKGWVRESMSPCASSMILVPKKDGA
ncbi:hypothetical protein CR513_22611, partial [Mucuna pruriens]